MLISFVLSFTLFQRKFREEKERADSLRVIMQQYTKIQEIEKGINNIDTNLFEYNSNYKKHVLKIDMKFKTGSFNIFELTDKELEMLKRAGDSIKSLLMRNKPGENIRYLVIIEGQASKDNYYIDDYRNNDVLSYQRALSLKKYWETKKIFLDKLINCELIVAGSGVKGLPRKLPDIWPNNQRFLIHIILKPGGKTQVIHLSEKRGIN